VVGITIAAFGVSVWLGGSYNPSGMARGLLISFIYTLCIGTLVTAVCTQMWPWAEYRDRRWVWPIRIGSGLGSVALGTLIAEAVMWKLGLIRGASFWRGYLSHLEFAAFISVTFGLTLSVYEYWRAKYEHSELERVRAMKLATEARLASLESRIHPHFLFNTLNSISSLIHSDPDRAEEQLQRLCALLRFSLDSSETPLVPLAQELKIVRDYLDIEKTRFGDRLRFVIDVPEELLQYAVPPLAVQTLAENSVKYVIAPSRAGGEVRIQAALESGRLIVTVADGGPGVTEGMVVPGHGLDNLRARLQVLFGDRAVLAFGADGVRLEVPI